MSSDAAKTAALLGIDFNDTEEGDLVGDEVGDELGMSSEELEALMAGSGEATTVQDEDELMRSLSELGIDGAEFTESSVPSTQSSAAAADALALMQQALSPAKAPPPPRQEEQVGVGSTDDPPPSPLTAQPAVVEPTAAAPAPPPPPADFPTEEPKPAGPLPERASPVEVASSPEQLSQPVIIAAAAAAAAAHVPSPAVARAPATAPAPPSPAAAKTPSAPAAAKTTPAPAPAKPPPLRYALDYKAKTMEKAVPPQPQGEDLLDDLFAAFTLGKQAVTEAYHEVKQSVTDLNSSEVQVVFKVGDKRLGMRVERRPVDDACEVTWVEPGSVSERIGVQVDDVVIGVDGRGGGNYDRTLRSLTLGTRPLNLLLLRPQPALNSPLNFKMENEIDKACRILTAITSKPSRGGDLEELEEAGRGVMLDLLKDAVGLVFMTTIKVGGLLSGMGGTGILVSRLPDGSWSAPVAVGAFGMSWGLQIGATHADVMIVFMKPSALAPFCSAEGTDLHLGPESGIAVGPVGRRAGVSHGVAHLTTDQPDVGVFANPLQTPMIQSLGQLQSESLESHVERTQQVGAEVASRAKDVNPAYTYSHCKGLFVGVSLEGSVLTVRPDVNEAFYKRRVAVGSALEGSLEKPLHLVKAKQLYKQLRLLTGAAPPPLLVAAGISPYTSPVQPRSPPQAAGGWAPPRDKWNAGGGSAAAPKCGGSGWVPPRDKWGTGGGGGGAFASSAAAAPANPFTDGAANPFSEPGSLATPTTAASKQPKKSAPPPTGYNASAMPQLPVQAEAFAIGGDEDGDDIVEFNV